MCRPSGAAEDISEILGRRVEVVVPADGGHNPQSQAVFRRGFLPAHRPILSSLMPSTGQADASASMMSDSDFQCVAAQGYALGFENSSAADSGPLDGAQAVDATSSGASLDKALHTKLQGLTPLDDNQPESPPHQNLNPNIRVDVAPRGMRGPVAVAASISEAPPRRAGASSAPRNYRESTEETGINQTATAAAANFTNTTFERSVQQRMSRGNMLSSIVQHGLSSLSHPGILLDRQQSATAGTVGHVSSLFEACPALRTDQEGAENVPSSTRPVRHHHESSWENLYGFPGMSTGDDDDDEEMWDIAAMEVAQASQPLHDNAQEGNQHGNLAAPLGYLMETDAQLSSVSTPTSNFSAMNGFMQSEADPLRDGTWNAGSSSGAARQGPGTLLASAREQGFSILQPRSTQMQVPSSLYPDSAGLQQAHEPEPSSDRRTPSPAPCAAGPEVAGEGAFNSTRERSHSPMSRRLGTDREQSTRFGKSSPYRGPTVRAAPAERFTQHWQGMSPTSRSSSLLSDDRASPVPRRSSSEEPSQSPCGAGATLRAWRTRNNRFFGDGATSSDIRAERVRLESLELHPIRQQSVEVLRSLQRQLSRTARMDSKKTRLQLLGSEAISPGVPSAMLSSLQSSVETQPVPASVPSLDGAPMLCEELPPCEGAKVIKILEMPLCSCGSRPNLIAQVNAQASPQFEKLGPYLVRIGCCKICKVQA